MKKRILSCFMALALCLTLLPATAQAADDSHDSHCICGKTHTAIGDHSDGDQNAFANAKWLKSQAIGRDYSLSIAEGETQSGKTLEKDSSSKCWKLPAGTYYLSGNSTLSTNYPIKIENNVTICLNGKWIQNVGKDNGPVFEVPTGCVLTLTDCKSDGRIKCDSSSGVYVSGGTLNLYSGQIANSKGQKGTDSNNKYGGGVYVNSGFFNMYGGTITGNDADYGGGVYVKNGTFNMYGGTIKNNNSNGGSGAGVYVEKNGNFIMKNTASVTGNTIGYGSTAGYGGGVYVNGGTFEMHNNASVTNNIANNSSGSFGGGVYVNSGTFNMTDGTIGGGNTANYGGGVYVNSGTFNMTDGTIGGATEGAANTATNDGGGVYVKDGKFVMNGPTTSVSGNTATYQGGGVYVEGGTFTMNDGTIGGATEAAANKADQGGGVRVSGGTFTMGGMNGNASITGNDGNGVYVGSKATFTVSGAPTVIGNTREKVASNVYLEGDNKTITIGKAGLTDDASIGVIKTRLLDVGDTIATGANKDYSSNFSIDDTQQYVVKYDETNHKLVLAKKSGGTTNPPVTTEHKHCLCGKTHTAIGDHETDTQITFATKLWMDNGVLKKGDNAWGKGTVKRADSVNGSSEGYVLTTGNYYLENDLTLNGAAILIDGDVKLCLNGHTIDRANGNAARDYVIRVLGKNKAHLTLTDCVGSGTIKGGGNGGVDIFGFCTLDMYGGSITENKSTGVSIGQFGTFNMYGGSITKNSADYGGGVYNGGTVNMYGGEISGNTASNKGGGVYMEASVGNYQGGILNVSGAAKITDNTVKGVANNVYLPSGKTIAIGTGSLSGTIGVTTETKPAAGKPVTVIAATKGITGLTTHVVSDDNAYETAVKGNTIVLQVVDDTGGGTTEIVPVDSITLPATATLKVGVTTTLTATVTPENATKKDVIWTSSNTGVATVENGTVTAVKAGTTMITATAADGSGKSATCTVTVTGGTTPPQPSNPGGSTGGNTGGSSGSSSSDSSDSNPIIKTETKNNADGSTTKTETRKDGSVTQTTTGKDGSVSKTETKKDGSSVTENKAADGSTGTVKTDKNGQTEAKTALSNKAIEDAKKSGEPVKAPVEVEAARNSNTAPTVKVELPGNAGKTEVEIPVSNATAGTVAVLVHPDGTEEILKASVPTENGIRLTVDGSATVKIVDNSKDFIDTRNHWAREEIDFVSARELVNGMSDTIYAPNASATRAQLWTILARQNDADLNGGNTWYEKAQLWSKDKGISDGTEPNAAINRAQMVTMLWRTMGQPAATGKVSFADVPAGSYYAQAVAWAVESGITQGVGGGKFDPTATCTRAQIATFLARSMK